MDLNFLIYANTASPLRFIFFTWAWKQKRFEFDLENAYGVYGIQACGALQFNTHIVQKCKWHTEVHRNGHSGHLLPVSWFWHHIWVHYSPHWFFPSNSSSWGQTAPLQSQPYLILFFQPIKKQITTGRDEMQFWQVESRFVHHSELK